jgi:hypothetical protein
VPIAAPVPIPSPTLAPVPTPPAKPKNQGEVSLRETQQHEDTIFIDQEGNLSLQDDK